MTVFQWPPRPGGVGGGKDIKDAAGASIAAPAVQLRNTVATTIGDTCVLDPLADVVHMYDQKWGFDWSARTPEQAAAVGSQLDKLLAFFAELPEGHTAVWGPGPLWINAPLALGGKRVRIIGTGRTLPDDGNTACGSALCGNFGGGFLLSFDGFGFYDLTTDTDLRGPGLLPGEEWSFKLRRPWTGNTPPPGYVNEDGDYIDEAELLWLLPIGHASGAWRKYWGAYDSFNSVMGVGPSKLNFQSTCYINETAAGVIRSYFYVSGRLHNTDPYVVLFALRAFNQRWVATITTTEGTFTCTATAAFSTGVLQRVEVDWDGSTIRLSSEGVNIGSAACTGTIPVHHEAHAAFGNEVTYYPYSAGVLYYALNAYVSSSRMATNGSRRTSTASYTPWSAPFTPPAEATNQAFVLRCTDDQINRKHHITLHHGAVDTGAASTAFTAPERLGHVAGRSIHIENMAFVGKSGACGAVRLTSACDSQLRDVAVLSCGDGIYISGTSYSTLVRDLWIHVYGKYVGDGFVMTRHCHDSHIGNITIRGGRFMFLLNDSGGPVRGKAYFEGRKECVVAYSNRQRDKMMSMDLSRLWFTDENIRWLDQMRSGIELSGIDGFDCKLPIIEMHNARNAKQVVRVGDGGSYAQNDSEWTFTKPSYRAPSTAVAYRWTGGSKVKVVHVGNFPFDDAFPMEIASHPQYLVRPVLETVGWENMYDDDATMLVRADARIGIPDGVLAAPRSINLTFPGAPQATGQTVTIRREAADPHTVTVNPLGLELPGGKWMRVKLRQNADRTVSIEEMQGPRDLEAYDGPPGTTLEYRPTAAYVTQDGVSADLQLPLITELRPQVGDPALKLVAGAQKPVRYPKETVAYNSRGYDYVQCDLSQRMSATGVIYTDATDWTVFFAFAVGEFGLTQRPLNIFLSFNSNALLIHGGGTAVGSRLVAQVGNGQTLTQTVPLVAETWHLGALTRTGTTYTLYQNSASGGVSTDVGTAQGLADMAVNYMTGGSTHIGYSRFSIIQFHPYLFAEGWLDRRFRALAAPLKIEIT